MFTLTIGLGVIGIAAGIGMGMARTAQREKQKRQFRRVMDISIPTLSMAQSVQYPRCVRGSSRYQ